MVKEEGQAAYEACGEYPGFMKAHWERLPDYVKKEWATVERTIANEALRRAAEVARGFWRVGKPEGVSFYDCIADRIEALIKEPGHE